MEIFQVIFIEIFILISTIFFVYLISIILMAIILLSYDDEINPLPFIF